MRVCDFSESALLASSKKRVRVVLLLLPISSVQAGYNSHFQFLLLPVSWGDVNTTTSEEERQPHHHHHHPKLALPAEQHDIMMSGHDQLMDTFWKGGDDDVSAHNEASMIGISSFLITPAESISDMALVVSVSVATALLAIAAAYLLITRTGSGTARKVRTPSSMKQQQRRRHSLLYLHNDDDDDDDDDDEEYGFVDTIKARHQLHQPMRYNNSRISSSSVDTAAGTTANASTTTHLHCSIDSKTVEEHHLSPLSTVETQAHNTAESSRIIINNNAPSVSSIQTQQQQQQQRPLSSLWAYRPSTRMDLKYKPLCPTVPEEEETEYSDDDDDDDDDAEEDEDKDYMIEEKATTSSVVMGLDGILSELAFALP